MDKERLIDLLKELFKSGTIQIIEIKEGTRTKLVVEIDGEWIEQEYT